MAKPPVRIGLIGIGRMGQNHLRVLSLLKGAQVEFIHDRDADAMERLGHQFGVRVCRELEPALDGIDAAVICTPTSTHHEYIRLLGAKVRKLFVEKPLTASLETDVEIAAWAAGKGVGIQVGFIERFNPVVQELKRIVDKADIGVINIDFTRTNRLSGRISDVDVITDLMIHDVDLALYLNGPVKSVVANGVRDGALIGYAAATLSHANGRFSRVVASRLTEKKMRSIQATCRDLFIDAELLRKEIVVNRQSSIRQGSDHYSVASLEEKVEVRQQEALLNELQAFLAFCADEPVAVPTAQDGLEAMRVCAEIQRLIERTA